MPRKGSVAKRDVLPDPVYNSKLVTRLINRVMEQGTKFSIREGGRTVGAGTVAEILH